MTRSGKLDAEVRALLEEWDAEGSPPLESLPPVEARKEAAESLRELRGEAEPVASVGDLCIPGPAGEIGIRVYTPEAETPRPGVLYFHGGGWVVCDLDTHDTLCRSLANRAGAVVVAVDYRLAPEHKFPAAVEDAYAAMLWVSANAAQFGIDPKRIAVCGDSAGGNLAAVVSLKCRDQGAPMPALQALVYPVTNLDSFDTASYKEFAEGYSLSAPLMEWFREHYLAQPEDGADAYASPLLVRNLSALPPAVIVTAECDVLRDEGEAYASRLKAAGVSVTCTRYAGMIHPFFSMQGKLAAARQALAQVAAAVRGMG